MNNVFLHRKLNEDVFTTQPAGFVDSSHPSYVSKLQRSIYGFKQTPYVWYQALRHSLLYLGFTNSLSDSSSFIYNKEGVMLYILGCVDDLLLMATTLPLFTMWWNNWALNFFLKDLFPLTYFLGIKVISTSFGLFLTQQRYVCDQWRTQGGQAGRAAPPSGLSNIFFIYCYMRSVRENGSFGHKTQLQYYSHSLSLTGKL